MKAPSQNDRIIFPIISMVSVEPVQPKHRDQLDLFDSKFRVSFTIFKENDTFYATCVLSTLTSDLPPRIITATVDDLHSLELENFISKPLSHFEKFKRAIIFFDDKPYSLKDFENTMTDWHESLQEILKQ